MADYDCIIPIIINLIPLPVLGASHFCRRENISEEWQDIIRPKKKREQKRDEKATGSETMPRRFNATIITPLLPLFLLLFSSVKTSTAIEVISDTKFADIAEIAGIFITDVTDKQIELDFITNEYADDRELVRQSFCSAMVEAFPV